MVVIFGGLEMLVAAFVVSGVGWHDTFEFAVLGREIDVAGRATVHGTIINIIDGIIAFLYYVSGMGSRCGWKL